MSWQTYLVLGVLALSAFGVHGKPNCNKNDKECLARQTQYDLPENAKTKETVRPQAMPTCDLRDEDCRDRYMHPDLREPHYSDRRRMLEGEDTTEYWRNAGKEFIRQRMAQKVNKNTAKNVIMFLGDGMGLTTIAAARNVIGGEHAQLSFEKFPYVGLAKTYSVDRIVSDSACTATAYLCGIKGNEGTIGVNGHVTRKNCTAMLNTDYHVSSIAKWAIDAGKSAGVVTTTRITHASPAGTYAQIAERDWEDDTEVAASCGPDTEVRDIAYQLIRGETGSKLKFVMGGGKRHFVDKTLYSGGTRSDGLNLIEEYTKASPRNLYLETRDELMNANLNEADRIFGLYQDSHMLYHFETNETTNQPTLEEMTRKAIEYLSKDENGYFIFIEGGRIDLAHHDNMARVALDETVEFSKAIQAAVDITNEEDTLIVVTADHSHAFSFSGYPYRGDDIFGNPPAKGDDGKPMMTLSYANGPGFDRFYDTISKERRDPTRAFEANNPFAEFPATVPLDSETHGGEDVPVFALGPWSRLFTGVYEQNSIPHFMGYAACLGDGLKSCT